MESVINALIQRRFEAVVNQDWFPEPAPNLTWSLGDQPHFQKERGFASVARTDRLHYHITLSPKILDSPLERLDGLVRHELGHLCDFHIGPTLTSKLGLPPKDHRERRADQIAEAVWGQPIYYDAILVQTTDPIGATTPRPEHLGL